MKRNIILLFLALFLVLFFGCHRGGGDSSISSGSSDSTGGSGGADGTGGTDSTGGTGGADEAGPVTPEVKIVLSTIPAHPGEFSIAVEISNAVNAAGVYFRLNYNSKIIQIKNTIIPENSVTKGAFFNKGEAVVGFLNQNPDSGCLLAGLSRPGENPGINGSGTIMTFTFITVGTGFTSVKFSETPEENSLFTPEKPLEIIPSVKWTNAEITVK